jgi:adenylylsulfate kinase
MAFTVWVTGADTDAVRAIATDIGRALTARKIPAETLDQATCGIDAVDARVERLVTFIAAALARRGVATIVALRTDARGVRERARAAIPRMIEVWVRATAAADGGAYEAPERAEVEVGHPEPHPGAATDRILHTLEVLGFLPRRSAESYSDEEERQVIRRLKAFGYL